MNLAIYIHWPFCAQKCPYCDFNSHVRDQVDYEAWAAAYLAELDYYRFLTGPRHISSVFFGGGTPSLMPPSLSEKIIDKINQLWGLNTDIEVTLEANPNSVEVEKFKAFKSSGINRVSIGIQSLNDDQLRFLGRVHNAAEGIRAIETARSVFERYSFDLIYARPGQSTADWERELSQALSYAGGHLSLYQLTIEPQTPFFTAHARGEFAVPGEDLAAELYTLTDQMMDAAGMPAYEISNYAKDGQESQHNLTYWHYGDYVGVGPGAHGRLTLDGVKYATRAHRAPEIWLERVAAWGQGVHPFTPVAMDERATEAVMMGLRLNAGFDLTKITDECGKPWAEIINPARITRLVESGDLRVCHLPLEGGGRREAAGGGDTMHGNTSSKMTIAPTLPGRLRLNQVINYLLHG